MSRAYRIRVNESERRLIRAGDAITTRLELLEILPQGDMAALLEHELRNRGFRKEAGQLRRDQDGVTVTVDPQTGEVTASADTEQQVKIKAEREGIVYDDMGPAKQSIKESLRERAKQDLEQQAVFEQQRLQRSATEKLERGILDLKKEFDQVVNRVTAEALKKKAAQMGQIKEIQEDAQHGSLTIVMEI